MARSTVKRVESKVKSEVAVHRRWNSLKAAGRDVSHLRIGAALHDLKHVVLTTSH